MKELLKQEIQKNHKSEVVNLLKDGAYEQITEEERLTFCVELMNLRDKDIVAFLAKNLKQFEPEMFAMDLDNWNNREFVNFVLDKYSKKFDWNDDRVCNMMFEVACKSGSVKTVRYLIKQRRAFSKYAQMGKASDDIFELTSLIRPDELENEYIVDMIVQAALSGREVDRLQKLESCGFDFKLKNGREQTAVEVLEERIENTKYAKNKTGELQKQKDKKVLAYLEKMQSGLIKPEVQSTSKKKWIAFIAAGAILLAIVIAIFASPEKEEKDYNTDPSLVVKNGDTVNIDYIGYVDGEAFDGGNTDGAGTSLTIGSGKYIDDFEEQLIGYNVGDNVEVKVTFPDNYAKESLQGK